MKTQVPGYDYVFTSITMSTSLRNRIARFAKRGQMSAFLRPAIEAAVTRAEEEEQGRAVTPAGSPGSRGLVPVLPTPHRKAKAGRNKVTGKGSR